MRLNQNTIRRIYLKLPREPSTFFKSTLMGGRTREGQIAFKFPHKKIHKPPLVCKSGYLAAKQVLWGLFLTRLWKQKAGSPYKVNPGDPRNIMFSVSGI